MPAIHIRAAADSGRMAPVRSSPAHPSSKATSRQLPRLSGLAVLGLLSCGAAVAAPLCFPATGKAGDDAQTIRLQAQGLGWTVGVPASVAAGSVIKGKVALYPKASITVCLAAEAAQLAIRVQASTADDKDAAWKVLPAKRKST